MEQHYLKTAVQWLGLLLLTPHPRISKPERRLNARLLASIMLLHAALVIFFVGLINWAYLLTRGHGIWGEPDVHVVLAGLLLSALCYLLLRLGFYQLAVNGYILACTAVPLLAPFLPYPNAEMALLSLALLPILLCALVYPARVSYALIALIAICGFLQLMLHPLAPEKWEAGMVLLPVTLIVGTLIILFRGHIGALEASRAKQMRASEMARQEIEQRHSQILNLVHDGVFIVDPEGRIIEANAAACQQLGYSHAELTALSVSDMSGRGRQELGQIFSRLDQERVINFESAHRGKEGRKIPVDLSISRVTYLGQPAYLGIARDISAQLKARRVEEQLRQSQKMEAVGNLAGGIAHDFNNILYLVSANAEMALDDVEPDSATHEHLSQILQASQRAAALVRQILTFSRRSASQPTRINPALLVREVVKLLRPALPSTIELRVDCSACSVEVEADPVELHQVLMNLCSNSSHAMDGRQGLLEITLRDVVFDRESAEQNAGLGAGLYVQLVVSDSGAGMSPEVLQHIYEPFYTTKEPGRGTGMGLAVVHGIVTSLGGSIRVYSESGQGTTFVINLPAQAAQGSLPVQESAASLPQGTGRLLLVDDETAIVQLLARMLEQLGYKVMACDNSLEAWEAFKARPADFDLLITDLTMPKLTGVELARRVLELRPELPILICTGFGQAVSAEQARQLGVAGYLLKPISRSDLAHAVHRQLQGIPVQV